MKILFYGELYPDVVHGVSMANRLNTGFLSEQYHIDFVQETTDIHTIGSTSIAKIKLIISSTFKISKCTRQVEYDVFYTVLSLSLMGIIKNFLSILSFSLFSKGRVVVHIHRGDFKAFYRSSVMHRLFVQTVFKQIDRLIVLSAGQKIEMAEFFSENAIFAVENSVLEEFHYPKKIHFNQNFIFISNYIKEKGIFDLLNVFNQRKDLKLDCYGAFNNNELALKNFQSDSVSIHHVIKGEDKFDAIYQADALILPSWNEGQPTILLEAMMVGTIILTTKVGLIDELLGEDYPFYFDPKNVESLKECIDKFLAYDQKTMLSRKLKEHYFERYSQDNHKVKILNAFSEKIR
jgi:glycosyltransferase involved in cell wall biosynthesis